MGVTNRVRDYRRRRGISATDLAARVGVSRQSVHAIESGTFTPNTAVALRLARALETSVEELFVLDVADSERRVRAESIDPRREARPGEPLRFCRVGERLMAAPWSPLAWELPAADGFALGAVGPSWEVSAWGERDDAPRLAAAGCDPALSVLGRTLKSRAGIELITAPSSSRRALEWLREGRVHVAGTHVEAELSDERGLAATFAEWREGLVVAPGNPKGLRAAEDLAARGVRFVNREIGSGSRALLDRRLAAAGAPSGRITGYDSVAPGHLAAAWKVRQGEADCCVAIEAAARVFGLDFVPWAEERFDLIVLESALNTPAVQTLLDLLQGVAFRRELSRFAGYDAARTGSTRPLH